MNAPSTSKTRTKALPMAWLLALCLMCLGLAGCDSDEPARKVDLEHRVDMNPPAPNSGLTYAYLPQYAHTVSHGRHRRLLAYLEQATGLQIRQVFPDTFEQHIEMAAKGDIDISFVNPAAYAKMAKSGATAFARIVEPGGETMFQGEIIARADNQAINSLDDCRGKRWIAVDELSAGGFLYPLGLFLDHGIRRRDFKQIAFAPGPGGKQEKVVMAVYAGTFDIGSVRDGTLDLMAGKIDRRQIKVLASSKAYPGWLFAARAGLDPAVVDTIAKAMFELDRNDPELAVILDSAGMRAIVPANDADFESVRELMGKLEKAE